MPNYAPLNQSIHHFHVINIETGEIVGMFASLYCAAQTILHKSSLYAMIICPDEGAPTKVRDVLTGNDYFINDIRNVLYDSCEV